MKRILAFTLVLALVLSLCAAAFADYYPTVQFNSSCKNKLVRYGKNVTMKIKCNQGTGPFWRVTSTSWTWIWRAGFTVVAKKGSFSKKVADYDFTGTPTVKFKLATTNLLVPDVGRIDKYKMTATSYYKPTIGTTVYAYRKYKSVKTNLRVYR